MADLVWPVSRSGYSWKAEHTVAGIDHQLVTFDNGEGISRYKPMLDQPDLFEKFARLEQDHDQYAEFAAQYGHLTTEVVVVGPTDLGDAWESYLEDAARCDRPGGQEHDPKKPSGGKTDLVSAIAFPTGTDDSPRPKIDVSRTQEPETSSLWGTHVTAMKSLLRRWRHSVRTGSSTVEIRREVEEALIGRIGFTFDSDTGGPSYSPTDLLSAIWLQFAFAVGGARKYKECLRCRRLFPVSIPNLHSSDRRRIRDDKVYCGDECQRGAAYELKKKKRRRDQTKPKRSNSKTNPPQSRKPNR